MFKGYFEKRTAKEYQRYNFDHSCKVTRKRIDLELEKWGIAQVPDSKDKTYDKIPNLKVYDFLRKAFEECEWNNVKKFRFKDEVYGMVEYHVDYIFYEFSCGGFLLCLLYHQHYDDNDYSRESHGILTIKNISSFNENVFITGVNDVEILE
jgi:hypothetical protein